MMVCGLGCGGRLTNTNPLQRFERDVRYRLAFQPDDVADEVPGFGSGGTTTDSPWDYCYAPNPSTLVFAGDSGCASSAQCMACHGDCDTDADCQGALRCFQRDGSVQVPGCNVGQAGDVAAADYCYDPDGEPDGRVCVAAGANALNNADFESDVVSVNASLPPTGVRRCRSATDASAPWSTAVWATSGYS